MNVSVNVRALLVFVGFLALVALAAKAGSSTLHFAEAAVTVLIVVGLAGYAFRGGQRRM